MRKTIGGVLPGKVKAERHCSWWGMGFGVGFLIRVYNEPGDKDMPELQEQEISSSTVNG
jgi:hypothetical protein